MMLLPFQFPTLIFILSLVENLNFILIKCAPVSNKSLMLFIGLNKSLSCMHHCLKSKISMKMHLLGQILPLFHHCSFSHPEIFSSILMRKDDNKSQNMEDEESNFKGLCQSLEESNLRYMNHKKNTHYMVLVLVKACISLMGQWRMLYLHIMNKTLEIKRQSMCHVKYLYKVI